MVSYRLLRVIPLAGAALMAACEARFVTDVDVELDEIDTELVLEAYVTPGDTALVYVSETTRITDSRDLVEVEVAQGRLLVDGVPFDGLVPARQASTRGYYSGGAASDSVVVLRSPGPVAAIPPGATVTVELTTEDGREVSAAASMPRPAAVASLSARPGQYGDQRLTLTVEDPAGPNAYLITGSLDVTDVVETWDERGDTIIVTRDTIRRTETIRFETGDEIDYFYHGSRFTSDDELFEGTSGILNFSAYVSAYTRDTVPPVAELRVATVNPLGAEYLYAFALADWNQDNPFVEPVVIPDGVEGGRGMLILTGPPEVAEFEVER